MSHSVKSMPSPLGVSHALVPTQNGPDEHRVVVLIDNDGKNAHAIVKGRGAIWSPDRTKLLFLRDSESKPVTTSICIANPDGSDPSRILNDETAPFGLAWFPDGNSIMFGSTRENKYQSEVFRINTDGTGLQKIASVRASLLHSPIVSPDRTKLLVNSNPAETFGDPYYWRSGYSI